MAAIDKRSSLHGNNVYYIGKKFQCAGPGDEMASEWSIRPRIKILKEILKLRRKKKDFEKKN